MKIIDLFCVDCDKTTRQIYRGILADGSHLYICTECGCENYENAEMDENI